MALNLRLLGSPTLESDGQSIPLPFERRSQLLAFLALRRSWVGRAELAAMLWPEQSDKLAYTNLRKTLFRLRALPWAPSVEVQGGALRYDAPTDVAAFESALREGRLREAAHIRRGDFLEGFDDGASESWSGWIGFERERLRSAWHGAVLARLSTENDPAEGIELSARLLEADPLDEAALQAHMSWLARGGRPSQAREAYRAFARRLQEDFGLAPGAELQALHESLATASIGPRVAAPKPDDGFIGRSVELRQVAALLGQPDCRLVCVIGPGGVGKTRLARRALHHLAAGYGDGATFVPLEDAAVASDVPMAMARELGIALSGRRDALGEVIDGIGKRHLLLALDNFEQLAPEAWVLERLLDECPRLQLLVTSRVRLGLASEQLLPIEGLPWPDAEDQDRFESFDAVRLFVRAARRLEPGFVPETEAAAIVEICRQVEGLPLAIELAAAWVRVMSCEAISSQLREGIQLLRAMDQARPARHASMQVVFDETWRLLGSAERDALARLSVFQGGFSAEAARAVTGAPAAVLGALADRCLLRKDGQRLHMHVLLQQLAAARLAESGAREATQRAHALHFHRLLAGLRKAAADGDRAGLSQLDTELPNWRLAWSWSLAHPMRDALAGSVFTLLHFCDHRFRLEEGLSMLREAAGSRAARDEPRLAALLLAAAAHLEYRLDRYVEAHATATRALAATDSKADHDARLQCFKVLGGCCLRLGRHAEARRWFEKALRQAPAAMDPNNAAAMLDNLARVEKALGNYAQALRLCQQSLLQHRLLGDAAGEALCLNNLGAQLGDSGDIDTARKYLDEGLALCERHGIVGTRSLILANLSELAFKEGRDDAAAAITRRALEFAEAVGNRALVSWLRIQTARIQLRRRDLEAARGELAAAMESAIAMGRPSHLFAALSGFAELLEAQGERGCARQVLEFCAAHPSIGAPERDEARARLRQFQHGPAPKWPGLELDELVHRIVLEASVRHAPLIATLRAAA